MWTPYFACVNWTNFENNFISTWLKINGRCLSFWCWVPNICDIWMHFSFNYTRCSTPLWNSISYSKLNKWNYVSPNIKGRHIHHFDEHLEVFFQHQVHILIHHQNWMKKQHKIGRFMISFHTITLDTYIDVTTMYTCILRDHTSTTNANTKKFILKMKLYSMFGFHSHP